MFQSMFLITLAIGLGRIAAAQVPMHQEPHHHLVFENESLRVMEPRIEAGEATLEHLHSHDDATICISGSVLRSRKPGDDWGKPGQPCKTGSLSTTEYSGKPSSHAVQNTGGDTFRLLAVENLRQSGWSDYALFGGAGAELVKESRAFRIYEVKLPGGGEVSHVHQAPTIAVMVSGDVAAGTQTLNQPGRWVFIPAGQSHKLKASGSGEGHLVEIEVR